MATRSLIAYGNGEKVYAAYCHWDGYPSGVGWTLFQHYRGDVDKVKSLISLGEFSSLRETVSETEKESYHYKDGEPIYIRKYTSINELLRVESEKGSDIEYIYFFSKDGKSFTIYGKGMPFYFEDLSDDEKEVIFKNGFSEEDFEYKYGDPLKEITKIGLDGLDDFQSILFT